MPEDDKQELVPVDAEVVSPEADTELDQAINQMSELVQTASASVQFQNVQSADMAARTAEALFANTEARLSLSGRLLLGILKHAACLFSPLTRVLVYQTEGRFTKALAELDRGLEITREGLATVDQYEKQPDHEAEVVQTWRPLFSIFPILLKGLDAYIRADIVGYQGRLGEYKGLLHNASKEFKRVDELRPSFNPVALALAGMCATLADRLQNRAELIEVPERRYLNPTGKKVFIIHGHDEAKWRELRDLIEGEFKLKTVVLNEEPGAGETLIRKFEAYAHDCSYAFALLTPDDFVEKQGKSYFQARPNVLFELGWFYGHFGRDRVCIMKKAGTEIPSDLSGILTIDFRDKISEGFVQIRDELGRVGVIGSGAAQ
jgi:predicted nucleotide-binding protein